MATLLRRFVGMLMTAVLLTSAEAGETPDLRFEPNQVGATFVGGEAALEHVLEHAESTSWIELLIGANTALHYLRLEDAAFLFYAGRLRAQYELQKYAPKSQGSDSPGVYLGFLVHNVSAPIQRALFLRPRDYARVIERVAAWDPTEADDFQPLWEYTEADVADDLAITLRDEFVDEARNIATLLNTPEFFAAFKTLRAFNDLPEEQQSEPAIQKRRAAAIATMLRIQDELQIKDYFGLAEMASEAP